MLKSSYIGAMLFWTLFSMWKDLFHLCFVILFFFLVLASQLVASIFFSQHWLGSCCPYHILMSVKHLIHSAAWESWSSAACQHYPRAADARSKELSRRTSPAALAHPAASRAILTIVRAPSGQHLVLSAGDIPEIKQGRETLTKKF